MAHGPKVMKDLRAVADLKFYVRLTLPAPDGGYGLDMRDRQEWLRATCGEGNYAWIPLLGYRTVQASCIYFPDVNKAKAFADRWPPAPFKNLAL